MSVFVLDKKKKPLMPTSEKRARLLLEKGRAVVVKLFPFTIRLKDRVLGETQNLRLKIDPGSRYTGLSLVTEKKVIDSTGEEKSATHVLNLFKITHRGIAISANLTARRSMRCRRRGNLRYRRPRFNNRVKPKGWLAPSLQHRVDTTMSFVTKIQKLAPITAISLENVRFDMQKMQDPEISGVQYQQGALQGYEVREYLLEKWGRKCTYCSKTKVPLEVEHIEPRSLGGSNRVGNLTLACRSCNQKKGNQPISLFLQKNPDLLQRIRLQAKKPLRDGAAVNSTRQRLTDKLILTKLPVELSSGGQTKYNRCRLLIPKTHALDAVCVGEVNQVVNWNIPTLEMQCMGRGSYKRTRLDKYGFPRGYLLRTKAVKGFQTGDMVKAVVTHGTKIGEYIGRVAVRASGNFNITTEEGTIQGISHRYCKLIARSDGYGYKFSKAV